MVQVRKVSWESFKERLLAIRISVFVDEQGIPIEVEQDEWDEKSVHILVSDNERDLATGRLLPSGYIGRVCVLKEMRGQGLGKLVMEALIEEARKIDMKKVRLSSQVSALAFYQNLGFEVSSEEYLEVDIPHVKMEKSLGD